MKSKKNKIGASDIALLAISVIFLIGLQTIFAACGPKEDGSWMTCHWASQAETGIAAVLTVIALIHLFAWDAKVKLGLDLAAVPLGILGIVTPGRLIHLCMMESMACRSTMRPAALVASVLVIAAAAFDFVVYRKKARRGASESADVS